MVSSHRKHKREQPPTNQHGIIKCAGRQSAGWFAPALLRRADWQSQLRQDDVVQCPHRFCAPKVGNYAGVTVERKEGKLTGIETKADIRVLDLPGTYSLSPNSLDEQVSRDVLLNRLPELPSPNLIVVVVDASNLQRNLYYATQVIELGHPTILALNMVDVAEMNGHSIDAGKLAELLSVPVMPIVASSGQGLPQLRAKIVAMATASHEMKPRLFCQLPGLFRIEATALADLLAQTYQERRLQATAEALLLLSNEKALASSTTHYPPGDSKTPSPPRANGLMRPTWIGAALRSNGVTLASPKFSCPSPLKLAAGRARRSADKADRNHHAHRSGAR